MPTITLYDRASPFKHGPAVTVATFEEKEYLDSSKTPTYVLLAKNMGGRGPLLNIYDVAIPNATVATLRITDAQRGNRGEFTVEQFGTYEIWL
jgi:hypothetical protein